MLTQLWDDLAGNRMSERSIQTSIDECTLLLPGEHEGRWVPEQDYADDAVAAAAYAFECRLKAGAQEAVWSGRRAYEALDSYVGITENIDWRGGPDERARAESRIIAHPLVQAELARQNRDLKELTHADAVGLQRTIKQIRRRARSESSIFFRSTLGDSKTAR